MEAYRHVQRLELAWFEQRRTGSLMSILNDDINQMERFLNGGANDLIQVVTGSALVGAVFFAPDQEDGRARADPNPADRLWRILVSSTAGLSLRVGA